jgi:hypothetical protein
LFYVLTLCILSSSKTEFAAFRAEKLTQKQNPDFGTKSDELVLDVIEGKTFPYFAVEAGKCR